MAVPVEQNNENRLGETSPWFSSEITDISVAGRRLERLLIYSYGKGTAMINVICHLPRPKI